MLMRTQWRIKLVGLVGGRFVMAVRFMGGRGYVLDVRDVNGGGEHVVQYGSNAFGLVGFICTSSMEFGRW
jgi:hypothetical protein